MIVEVCVTSLDSARIAEQAGADRLELCQELGVGGVTPSLGLYEQVRRHVSLPVHVLIRPRSGNFSYSDAEWEVMKTDIARFRELGAEGIVCGSLSTDNQLDIPGLERLLEWSEGINFTFHRAFDWVEEPLKCFDILQQMGVDILLTSGQAVAAIAGLPLLRELNQRAENLTVMPGAGIRPENALEFKEAGFKALHLSGTNMYENLPQSPSISLMGLGLLSETHVPRTDYAQISEVVQKVKL